MSKKAEYIQPVIDADIDDTSSGECASVQLHLVAVSEFKATSVDPDRHRKFFLSGLGRCPNVEKEAVFTLRHLQVGVKLPCIKLVRFQPLLHAHRSEIKAFAYPFPSRTGLRQPPPVFSCRGSCVWDPFKYRNGLVIGRLPLDQSALGFYDFNSHSFLPDTERTVKASQFLLA